MAVTNCIVCGQPYSAAALYARNRHATAKPCASCRTKLAADRMFKVAYLVIDRGLLMKEISALTGLSVKACEWYWGRAKNQIRCMSK